MVEQNLGVPWGCNMRADKMDDEMCREILMYVADDKSESEIQKILDIPLGTVSSRKSNCIKKLADIMKI